MKKPRDARQALLARVHIAWKEMGIKEDAYRDILRRVTGQESARALGDGQLTLVLDEFKRLGWAPKVRHPVSANPQVRIIYAIWKDIQALLPTPADRAELRAFTRRMTGKDAPEFCDGREATLVIEGLKGWRENLRKGGAA